MKSELKERKKTCIPNLSTNQFSTMPALDSLAETDVKQAKVIDLN
jgi:hypothetical protein